MVLWCCARRRPPQTSHCPLCGFCVSKFDHHCGVVGNCVGRRNHRFFVLLLVSASVGLVFLELAAIKACRSLLTDERQWKHWRWYVALPLAVVHGCCLCTLGFFALGQLALSCVGITEKEVIRGQRKDLTCKPNCWTFWCAPLGKGMRRSSHPFGRDRGYCWYH